MLRGGLRCAWVVASGLLVACGGAGSGGPSGWAGDRGSSGPVGGGASDEGGAGGGSRGADAGGPGSTWSEGGSPSPGADGGPGVEEGGPVAAGMSSGTIGFHLLLGVSGSETPGDSLPLAGDGYTDLIASNFVAGVMYGHLIKRHTPGIQFDADYLYGSIFGQLLQENLATELYSSTSSLIDSSPDQQAVMGTGQGGPYQINNYAADMVYGTYAPKGYSLINYVAVQKNIGYAFASAATQYEQATPASFNDKFYGPMLTAYFHYNDYVALHAIGPEGGYTPPWEPAYDDALADFAKLPQSFLDVLLNVAYNQGYYGPLVTSYSQLGATATAATVSTVDSYSMAWGVNDTYQQYPFQVRDYLDQLYDNPAPMTGVVPDNHVVFRVAGLGSVFASVFQTLAYVDASSSHYGYISAAQASAAFDAALTATGTPGTGTLDLSNAAERAQIFALLEQAIATLETNLGTDFTATTLEGL